MFVSMLFVSQAFYTFFTLFVTQALQQCTVANYQMKWCTLQQGCHVLKHVLKHIPIKHVLKHP